MREEHVRLNKPSITRAFRWTVHLLVSITTIALLSGCLALNDVNQISTDRFTRPTPKPGRALVMYGGGGEEQGSWSYPRFGVALDEYSVERQAITGNCWRFNRMFASVTAISGTREYFLFDVQPGFYTYSWFNGAQLTSSDKTLTFEVPPGRIVYLGDFIYARGGGVEVRRNLSAVKSYFKEDLLLADTLLVHPPQMFLCMP